MTIVLDADQMRRLMDTGVVLTAPTNGIVWLVEREVNGRKLLVPKFT